MPSLGISSCCFFEFIGLPDRKVLGVYFFLHFFQFRKFLNGYKYRKALRKGWKEI